MSIESERLSAFQTRMNSWVSSQGLFFQLRHGGSVEGGKSAFFAGMMRLLLRCVLLAMVLGVVFWVLLAKRVQFGWFRDQLGEQISLALGADAAEVGGLGRTRGQLTISKMVLEGGPESFFYDAQMWGIRTTMGLTDGVLTPWDGGRVLIKELNIQVKSGADTSEEASKAFQSLFKDTGRFQFGGMEVEDATLRWGYSVLHRGSIRNSRLVATRIDSGWKVVFTGGKFSQNWLQRLDIERIVALVTEDGVVFEEVKLKQGEGTMSMKLDFVKGGARPEVDGAGTFSRMPIYDLVDTEFRDFVEGTFSGTFSVSGSTNSQEGLSILVTVNLEEGDQIALRDRFSLFRAVSAVDRFRSYKKVQFTTGRLEFETGNGVMQVRDAWLLAPDLMRMEGGFLVRPTTLEEAAEAAKVEARPTVGGMSIEGREEDADDLTLARAAKAARDEEGDGTGPSIILSKEFGTGTTRDLETDALVREKRSPFFEGSVRLGLIKEVFDRSPGLAGHYPVDPDHDVRWLAVPMKGNIFSVGVKQAEELFARSRKGRGSRPPGEPIPQPGE